MPFVYFVPVERPHVHIDIIVLITILPLGALLSASVGLLIGTSVSPRQIPLVFALLVVPLTFLGAVYYPWSSLSVIRWLQVLTLANPLLYMSEGLRGALTPTVRAHELLGRLRGADHRLYRVHVLRRPRLHPPRADRPDRDKPPAYNRRIAWGVANWKEIRLCRVR